MLCSSLLLGLLALGSALPAGAAAPATASEFDKAVAPFLAELRITLPVLRDPDGAQAEQLGGANLPFAVLIDRRGQVRFRHEGAADGHEETLAKEAEALVAESAP